MPSRELIDKKRSLWSVILYAINLTVSGQILFWNRGFRDGFWLFFIVFGVITFAFACIILSISEISSCLPFSGGSFAFARVSAGPFVGFLVGACDRIDLVANAARSLFLLSYLITQATEQPSVFIPICLVFQYIAIIIIRHGDKPLLFNFSSILAVYSILLLTIFILSSLSDLHYKPHPTFLPVMFDSARVVFPLPVLFFNGVHVVQTATLELKDARKHMPMLLIGTFLGAFLLAVTLIFILASHAPYDDYTNQYPIVLTSVFASSLHVKPVWLLLLFVPFVFGSFISYFLALKRQMISMAQSNLLLFAVPEVESSSSYIDKARQQMVVFVGHILIFLLIIFGWFIISENWLRVLTKLSILGGSCAQIGTLYSFIVFRWRYRTLNRKFISPVGVPGAIFATLILALVFLSIVTDGSSESFVILGVFLLALLAPVIWYIFRLHKLQTFSKEESSVMFALHVINFNQRRKRAKRTFKLLTLQGKTDLKDTSNSHHGEEAEERSSNDNAKLDPLQRQVEQTIRRQQPTLAIINQQQDDHFGKAAAIDRATSKQYSERYKSSSQDESGIINGSIQLSSVHRSGSSDAQQQQRYQQQQLYPQSPPFRHYFVSSRRHFYPRSSFLQPHQQQQVHEQVKPVSSLSNSLDDTPPLSIRRNAGWDQLDFDLDHHNTMEAFNHNAFLEDVFDKAHETEELQDAEEEGEGEQVIVGNLSSMHENEALKGDE